MIYYKETYMEKVEDINFKTPAILFVVIIS